MFITKRHISRRTVLKGAGAALALPLLDAMVPAATALAQTAASPKPRFVGCFVPHGAAPGYWVPEKVGDNPDIPFNWKPLEPFREHLTIEWPAFPVGGAPPGATGADPGCGGLPVRQQTAKDHRRRRLRGHDDRSDHRAADRRRQPAAVDAAGRRGSRVELEQLRRGLQLHATNTISWSSPTQPLPMELNPQVVFERMFGDGSTVEQRAARRKRDNSILDSLNSSLSHLRGEISARTARGWTTTRRTSAKSSGACRSR
jgi:hypothetical protein